LSETSFTKPNLILKIRAPTDPIPNPASNVTSALKNIDQDYDVICTGTNHVLLQSYFDHSDKVFKESHQQYLQYHAEKDDDNSIRYNELNCTVSWQAWEWLDGVGNSGIFKTMKRQWNILITGL
jgi:hypothetical protein